MGSSRSFAATRKEAELFCGSFLRKGVVLAYAGRNQNLKDRKLLRAIMGTACIPSHARLRTALWPLTASHMHWWAGSCRSFTGFRKGAGFFCRSFLLKGQVVAYVGRNQDLNDLR